MTVPFRRVSLLLLASLSMAACAPVVQTAFSPPAGFAGPAVVEQGMGVGHFRVQDGAALPLRVWRPQGSPRAVIIALHGFNDHSASWRMAGPWWAEQGIEVWAYDQRGFGAAPGRGIWADPELSREDLRTITALVRARHPDLPIAIAGESMGGALGITAFASSRPPVADRLILFGPAVWGWSSQSTFNRIGLAAGARLLGDRKVEPPSFAVRHIRATDNVVELLRNGRDPRFILATRFDALYGLVELMEQASDGLARVRVPTFVAYGANDRIVPPAAMRMALEQAAGNDRLTTAYYLDGWHILNRDLNAGRVYADTAAWIEGNPLPSSPPPVLPALANGDE